MFLVRALRHVVIKARRISFSVGGLFNVFVQSKFDVNIFFVSQTTPTPGFSTFKTKGSFENHTKFKLEQEVLIVPVDVEPFPMAYTSRVHGVWNHIRLLAPVQPKHEASGHSLVSFLSLSGIAAVSGRFTFQQERFVDGLINNALKPSCRGSIDATIDDGDGNISAIIETKTLKKLSEPFPKWRWQVAAELLESCRSKSKHSANGWVTDGINFRLSQGEIVGNSFFLRLSPILDLSSNFDHVFPAIMGHLFPSIRQDLDKHYRADSCWLPFDLDGLSEKLHEIKALKEWIGVLEKKNADFDKVIEKKLSGLKKENAELKKEIAELKKENAELKNADFDKVFEKKLSGLKKENAELKKEIAELKKENAELKKQLTQLEGTLREIAK
jgi:hypothetical protein